MEYVQLTLNDWLDMKKELERELQAVKQSFVRIGYFLRKIDDNKLYEQEGYKSVAEFAKTEYGLEASTVSRFMQINKRFSVDGYSERLLPEYKDFKRMHLEEMLKLPESDYSMIRPDTQREAIRELKKFNKEESVKGVADDIDQLIEKFFADNAELQKLLMSAPRENIKVLVEIVNPGGNRFFRKGMFFMAMHENDISIKGRESGRQDMKWEEFFERAWKLFEQEQENESLQPDDKGGIMEACPVPTRPKDGIGTVQSDEYGTDVSGKRVEAVSTDGAAEGAEPSREDSGGSSGTDEAVSGRTNVSESNESTDQPTQNSEKSKGKKAAGEIAPAQRALVNTRTKADTTTKIEFPKEEPQVPGQREISDYEGIVPDNLPMQAKYEEAILRKTSEIIVEEKRWTRKEYLDDCTTYGAAVYLCQWFRNSPEAKEILSDKEKLEQWMKVKVDYNGREDE